MQRKRSAVFFFLFFLREPAVRFYAAHFSGRANVHAEHHLLDTFGHFILRNFVEIKILTKIHFS